MIIGGSVAGLGAALGLANHGHDVVVLERDRSTDARTGVDAFARWRRSHVPQFRQPHTVLARARNLLVDRAPGVVERLKADGIEEVNFIRMFTQPEAWTAEDDALTSFMTRRPAFELAMRREVEATTTIELCDGRRATGLLVRRLDGGVVVDGVQAGSDVLHADVVIDAAGRRTPVPAWLADHGIEIPCHTHDCELTYHSRHYELTDDSTLDLRFLVLLRSEIQAVATITFPGEHRTFALCLCPAAWEVDLKVLRHTWAWEAAVGVMPGLARWVDPVNARPLGDVATMAGHSNVLREYVADGQPLVAGLLPVGDAWCATNPNNAWGISLGLTTAFAAADAVEEGGGDPVRTSLVHHEAMRAEVEEVFVESAAIDRARGYRWRGMEPPEHDRGEFERQLLLSELGRAATQDADLEMARLLLRRVNLIDSPRQTLADPDVVTRLTARREARRGRDSEKGPTIEDLRAALAGAS